MAACGFSQASRTPPNISRQYLKSKTIFNISLVHLRDMLKSLFMGNLNLLKKLAVNINLCTFGEV